MRCGRHLKNPVSIEIGMGPVCAGRHRKKSGKTFDMFRANFTYKIIDGVICITDLDTGKSVTNDVENVLSDISAQVGTEEMLLRPIIYCDSMQTWDGIKVNSRGEFESFFSISETDQTKAIKKAWKHWKK
jgi:hypothetical protein